MDAYDKVALKIADEAFNFDSTGPEYDAKKAADIMRDAFSNNYAYPHLILEPNCDGYVVSSIDKQGRKTLLSYSRDGRTWHEITREE